MQIDDLSLGNQEVEKTMVVPFVVPFENLINIKALVFKMLVITTASQSVLDIVFLSKKKSTIILI